MTTYQSLGPAAGGPNIAAADQTGLNTGNLTNQLTGSFIGKNVPQFELYHATVTNVPSGGQATIYLNRQLYSFTYPLTGSEWDPSQPMFLRPGDEVDFFWNIAAPVPTPPAPSLTVTATASGAGSFNGMSLTVKAVTGAAVTQNGMTGSATIASAPVQLAITPNASGSWIYGALGNQSNSTTFTANAASTLSENYQDATNGSVYATCRSTSTTTAATPVTVGASAPSVNGDIVLAEILALTPGSLAEDVSSPPSLGTSAAKTLTTASFAPPAGSLLVAQISANYAGAGSITMTLSGGGLTWTELVHDTNSLNSIWIAQEPGGAAPAVVQYPVVTAFFRFDTDLNINKPYATGGGL